MEQSLSSLTYKGSISEAILEATNQKKLLVVYISGEDAESVNLENTTWTDLKVVESLLKYAILLHITEGSADAANFYAIYPQKSVPSITTIGYNGTQVWKSEGFVTAEVVASSLEKAWLSLHIQETTASVLTAALASKKSELPTSGTSVIRSSEQGSSSGTTVASPASEKHDQSSEARALGKPEIAKEKNTEVGVKASSKPFSDSQSGSVEDKHYSSTTEAAKNLRSLVIADPEHSGVEHTTFATEEGSPGPEMNIHHHSGVHGRCSPIISAEAVQHEGAVGPDGKIDASGDCGKVSETSDVHLNIRLPNGVSLQEKFSVASTLRMVKDHVDRNQASGMGSYDLAIPYPRKVFSDQDLSKSLSELSLFNRQALIVVPHQRASGYHEGGSLSSEQTNASSKADSSNDSEAGYFAFIKGLLSYVNPLSYFGGDTSSSSSGKDSQTGTWEYSPNPALRDNLARNDRTLPFSPNHGTSSGSNDRNSKKPTTARFGSNIHTLRHDEDDDRFKDRNAFWNGNSTQYGSGDNNGR
ncbi:hypothetical protein Dsin_018587 [Dipteronia sinensis]|uniref:UBX domain-containing protein n=1 Tax=Dipteronia sinensis TaxID=43782 RepID=A0AAE0A738_9ROSI|nr:hypothetical protein Dsin_018587 [Dipteronia sinensis]